jgi:hypothetical protein
MGHCSFFDGRSLQVDQLNKVASAAVVLWLAYAVVCLPLRPQAVAAQFTK